MSINKVGIIGSGAMGAGIAQVAAMAGFEVLVYDMNQDARAKALKGINFSLAKLTEKGKITDAESVAVIGRIGMIGAIEALKDCNLIIEAIVEKEDVKKTVFKQLDMFVCQECIIASNTSSLSITSLASSLSNPERFVGIHFFNPPVLMSLVEVIAATQTSPDTLTKVIDWVHAIGKTAVKVKDTPGFIVNKVARPFYSEALRIYEEGIADIATIDQVMRAHGFRMGPFELMDFIGHDVNYRVTEAVWKAFYYNEKYRPAHTQLKLMEAGYFGRKSDRGFYLYQNGKPIEAPQQIEVSDILSSTVFRRIIAMLVNEAADTVYLGICTEDDVEQAMKLGVNYPKGLLAWGKEIGYTDIVQTLDDLYDYYHESRYSVSPMLRKLAKI